MMLSSNMNLGTVCFKHNQKQAYEYSTSSPYSV